MKSKLSVALIVMLSLLACSEAKPYRKRMVYYQQPMQYYSAQSPQRLMYVQYMSPASPYARSTQSATALVAGETVATGTYIKDCAPAEADIPAAPAAESQTAEDALNAAGVHSSHAVAEAYPAESATKQTEFGLEEATTALAPTTTVFPADEEPATVDHESKVPRDFNFDVTAKPAIVDLPPARVPLAPIAPIAPVANPQRRYIPPKKKVYVELEETPEPIEDDYENAIAVSQEHSETEEGEENDLAPPAPIAPRRPAAHRPAAKKPVQPVKPVKSATDCVSCGKAGKPTTAPKPLPAGTFFPIDFGGTSGGAIAIANAFSTGEGGSATSHAIAYGSPDTVRGRVQTHKRH